MGFLPKRLTLQNLNQVSVYVEDTGNKYFNVQEVPETITQGRYAFKLFGSDFIQPDVELKIELLDAEGNPIFLAPVDFVGEEVPPYLPYRYVSIEVYSPPINVPGLATLTILGQIRDNKIIHNTPEDKDFLTDVPSEFQNAYNVRYQTTLNVDLSTAINTQPIRFFKNPTTEFKEVVQAKTVLTPISQSIVTSTAIGLARSDLRGKIIEIESGSMEKEALPKEISDTFKDLRSFKDEYKYKTGLRGKTPSIIKRRGLSTVFASKEEPKFKIKSDSPIFKADMQGGFIEVPKRTVTLKKINPNDGKLVEEIVTVPKFKTKILEVIDEKTIVPEEPPIVTLPTGSIPTGNDIQQVTIEDFSSTPMTASFNVTNLSPSKSPVNFDSLLELTIKNMRTFSGDIYRVRVHGKSEAAGSDFTVLTDTIVESPELLVDKNSSSGVLRTGYFLSQGHINTYWNSSSFDSSTKGANISVAHTGSHFIDSLHLSGSTAGFNQSIVVETKPLRAFTLRKNVAYTVSAKIKGKLNLKEINEEGRGLATKGKLYFHLSGSNLNTSKNVTSHTHFGSELTDDATDEPVVLQLDEDINGIQNFETIEHTFRPKFNLDKVVNTDTVLQIRAESGEWFISDLSLRPAMDTGFSPDEFDLKVPIPRSIRPDRFDFLVEYFDINNNVAETVTILQDVPISGSALVIDGDGNLLTGSLFMGSVAGEGIEAAGVNSAFVRSVGYEGFQSASLGGKGGFMIFSGSVLPNAPDAYQGAGLEIHDGSTGVSESYFKFRTSPSLFDVRTSNFFFGKESTPANFISGSNGNLEISSSNFTLARNGDVTMAGTVSASAGSIGGFSIGTTTLATEGVKLGNSVEQYFISSSAFKVDHTGNITASNIDLGGKISATSGEIGGWVIEDGQLSAGTGDSAVSLSADLQIISMGTGSTFNKGDLAGGLRMGIDDDGEFKFAVGSAASYLVVDNEGVSIKSDSFDVTASVAEIDVDIFKLKASELFISSSGGGFIRMGSTLPTGVNGTNKGIYMQGSNNHFLAGNAAGGHLKFDGTNVSISSSAFYLGNDTNFISGSEGNIEIFSAGTTTLSGSQVTIETPKFFLGQGETQFVSGSEGNIEISSSMFHLDPKTSTMTMSGSITANDGIIGGFTIGSNTISTTGALVGDSTQPLFLSSSIFKVDHVGNVTASNVDLSGKITATTGEVGGFTIDGHSIVTTGVEINDSTQQMFISSSAFKIDHFGNVTASNVDLSGKITATSGEIGGYTIDDHSITTTGVEINDSTQQIFISSSAFKVDHTGNVTASNVELSGKITAETGTIGGFNIGTDLDSTSGILKLKGASGQITASAAKITGNITAETGQIAGFTVSGNTLTATNFTLDASGKRITLGSGDDIFIADGDEGIQVGDATFGDAPFSVTKAGVLKSTSGTIGGWTLGSSTIVGNNLTLDSSGIIETNDFASDVQGFRLDSAGNGSAEFQNVKIRGTLSTAVFEKETVNAVGGQLYVANSTALTGSLAISASAATMSVVNVSGFTGSYSNDGEIIVAKKLTSSGFSTEYLLIQSASRDNPTSDTNFAGKLFVVRGYRSGSAGDNSFLGDLSSVSQSYAPGQVFASTGRIGTGYIRLNANPSDTTTPYIDIVERTGSGVYDVDLKARLGDLSGLSTSKLHGTNPASAGFGLYSQNVFLEGGIVANTGSIGGIEMESGKLYNGAGVHGNSNTGFYVDSGSKFSLGDKFVWDGSDLAVEGSITITAGPSAAQLAALNATTASLETSVTSLGESTSSFQTSITSLGESTSSFEGSITSLGQATSSFEGSITSLGQATSSLGSQITGAVDSGSAFASNAVTSGSEFAASAVASGSLFAFSAVASGSEFASSAVASGSLFAASAVESGSLFADNAVVSASLVGAGAAASSSAVQTNLNTVSASTTQRIMTDISGSLLNIPASPAGEGLFLNFPHMGFYSGSAFTAFISASGGFLFKADDDNLISFGQSQSGGDGSTTKAFVLKSNNVFLSGSNVNILGERFFLGGGSQFVSGSNGNIEISSSNFHLDRSGNVNMSGKITSTEGSIGGFAITSTAISSSNDNLVLNADGGITGSKFLLTGGIITDDVTIEGSLSANSISTPTGGSPKAVITDQGFASFVSASIAGFEISGDTINSTNDNLILKSSGQITASAVSMSGNIDATGGSIGGIKMDSGKIFTGTGTYSNSNTGFYLDSTGDFSLQDKFVWDASENSLAVVGNITITAGPTAAQLAALNVTTASLETSVTSLGESTSSFEGSISSLGQATASLQSATASFEGSISALGTATSSFEDSISALGESTASLLSASTASFTSITAVGASSVASASAFSSGAVTSGSLFASNAEATASIIGASANASASAFGSGAVTSGSLFASNAEATASIIGASANASASAFGSGAVTSGSLFASNAEATASIIGISSVASSSAFSINAVTSGSLFAGNAVVSASLVGVGAAASSSAVQTNLNTVSSSTAERIMTDATGSVLDLPSSPAGDGLYLNYPYMGFYGKPTITDTTYVVTAPGGSGAGYYIDGVQRATVELQAGYTYRFDTSAVGSHPFRFSTDSGNSSAYTTGVTVGSGYVDIEVTSSTPSTLYYYCTAHGGMGGQVNVVDNSEFKAFISASGGFLFKADDDNLISFGQSVSGGDGADTKAFVLKSNNVFLSGSNVNILTRRFFFGDDNAQFISGSQGNIEISSSMFHLDPQNNKVVISGSITATDGTIGGMSIDESKIQSTADAGDGSTTTFVVTANGSSNYIIDGVAQPTLTFIPGNIYKFDVSDDSNGSHPLRFTESDGGTDYYTTGLTINGTQGSSGAYVQLTVTQNTPNPLYYRCTAHGGMGNSITVDKTSPLVLDGNTGQISGSRFLFTGGKISGSSVEMDVENVTISGSSVNIQTPKFYLGETGQFISGSEGNIEISSSKFHLKPDGDVVVQGAITAETGEIGGFNIGENKLTTIKNLDDGFFTSMSFQHFSNSSVFKLQSADSSSAELDSNTTQLSVNKGATQISVASRVSSSVLVAATQAFIATGGTTRMVLKAEDGRQPKSNFFEIRNNPQTSGTTIFTGNSSVSGSLNIDEDAHRFVTKARTRATSSVNVNGVHSQPGGFFLQLSGSGPSHKSFAQFFVGVTDGSHIYYDGENNNIFMSSSAFEVSDSTRVTTNFGASEADGGVRIGIPQRQHVITNGSGMFFRFGDDTMSSFEGTTATIGQTTGTNNNVFVDSDSVDIRSGTQVSASFGTTTTIGPTTGKHVKITAEALEIKTDATTTALSASAAGLEMQGKVNATSGNIAGFDIELDGAFGGASARLFKEQDQGVNTSRMVLSPSTGSFGSGIFRLESIGNDGEDYANAAQVFDVVHPKSGFAGFPQQMTMASVIHNLKDYTEFHSGLINYNYDVVSGSYFKVVNNAPTTSSRVEINSQLNGKKSSIVLESKGILNTTSGLLAAEFKHQPTSRFHLSNFTNAASSSMGAYDSTTARGFVVDTIDNGQSNGGWPGMFVGDRSRNFIFSWGRPDQQHLVISSSIFDLDTLSSNVNFSTDVKVFGSKGKTVIDGNFISGSRSVALTDTAGYPTSSLSHLHVDGLTFNLGSSVRQAGQGTPDGELHTITFNRQLHFDSTQGGNNFYISRQSDFVIAGALSKGSGTFRISHPDPDKNEKYYLQHSFVESPTRGDNIYRWQVDVKEKQHTIELPDYYKHLNENDMVWINAVKHFGKAYGEVNTEQTELTIHTDTDGLYNVLLIGTRKDEVATKSFAGVEPSKSYIKELEEK